MKNLILVILSLIVIGAAKGSDLDWESVLKEPPALVLEPYTVLAGRARSHVSEAAHRSFERFMERSIRPARMKARDQWRENVLIGIDPRFGNRTLIGEDRYVPLTSRRAMRHQGSFPITDTFTIHLRGVPDFRLGKDWRLGAKHALGVPIVTLARRY